MPRTGFSTSMRRRCDRSSGGPATPFRKISRSPEHKPNKIQDANPDYSWMGVWRMSGDDHIRALTRQYSYRRFRFSPVWRFTCRVNGGFILILGLNRRYMPRCVGNLNNQG